MERLQTFLQKKYFKESEVQNRGGGAIDGRLKNLQRSCSYVRQNIGVRNIDYTKKSFNMILNTTTALCMFALLSL